MAKRKDKIVRLLVILSVPVLSLSKGGLAGVEESKYEEDWKITNCPIGALIVED